ncbi:MAG: hypothetical protein J3K34DRAFT_399977 [Monoraphidium minutum]|nr:MAG: hypothetical protein J3K34DRAFT_399977 [Monoraphidium minutum]
MHLRSSGMRSARVAARTRPGVLLVVLCYALGPISIADPFNVFDLICTTTVPMPLLYYELPPLRELHCPRPFKPPPHRPICPCIFRPPFTGARFQQCCSGAAALRHHTPR